MDEKRTSQNSLLHLTLIGLLAFLLSSCVSLADPETSQVHQQETIYTLVANEKDWVGQSFISRREGLNSITIYLSPTGDVTTTKTVLIAELFHSIYDDEPLYTTRLVARNGALRITFPPQNGIEYQDFFLKLQVSGLNIQVKGRNEDIYPMGEAYAEGSPIQGDLAFSTTYDYGISAFISDIQNSIPKTYLILPLFAGLFLPGFIITSLLLPGDKYDPGEKIAISVGLSLASLPLIMLWTGLAGISWNRATVQYGAGFLFVSSGFLFWRKKIWQHWRLDRFDLALIVVFVSSLIVRLIMVRDMAGTAWIDSVHHGLITRLILESGTLPTSFLPYFDISPTDYHPGFHTSVAVFTWLSHLDMDQAMLLFGQVLNALVVFAVYSFTKTLTNSKLAGLAAALATGLCTPMPAYYTTWGRYTQLAGTMVLPAPFVLFQKSLKNSNDTWRTLVAACICAGGLFLIHYRVMAFLVLLMGLYYVIFLVADRSKRTEISHASLLAIICVCATGLVTLPWLVPMITRTVLPLSNGHTENIRWFSDFSWRLLNTALGQPVMAFAAFGLTASILLKKRFGYLLVLWVAALFLVANPTKIGLPGAVLNNTSVAIFLFLPISTLAGFAIELVDKAWQQMAPGLYKPFMASLIIAGIMTGYSGSQRILPILNPGTILLRQADLPALEWAAANLPKNSPIAINPFLWGYGLYAGSDGGFWLAPVAGLRTIPPPVISSMEGANAGSTLSKKIIEFSQDATELASLLRNDGIKYIYLGARGGVISPAVLSSDPQYKVLYQAGGVWIFQIINR